MLFVRVTERSQDVLTTSLIQGLHFKRIGKDFILRPLKVFRFVLMLGLPLNLLYNEFQS